MPLKTIAMGPTGLAQPMLPGTFDCAGGQAEPMLLHTAHEVLLLVQNLSCEHVILKTLAVKGRTGNNLGRKD